METSPLRFLDTDVAYLLNKAVRKAISEESRRFYMDLWQQQQAQPLYEPVIMYNDYEPVIMYNDYDPPVHNPKQNIVDQYECSIITPKSVNGIYTWSFDYIKNLLTDMESNNGVVKTISDKYHLSLKTLYITLPCGNISNGAQCMCDICSGFDLEEW